MITINQYWLRLKSPLGDLQLKCDSVIIQILANGDAEMDRILKVMVGIHSDWFEVYEVNIVEV